MQYKPILDAIEAIIKADATANGLIGVYRTYEVEPGVSKTPVCVIGASTEMAYYLSAMGSSLGTRPRFWVVSIQILILGRSYPTQMQLVTEVEKLDAAQAAVFTVLNANSKLSNTVSQSLVKTIRGVSLPGGEYFGHAITLEIEKKEG